MVKEVGMLEKFVGWCKAELPDGEKTQWMSDLPVGTGMTEFLDYDGGWWNPNEATLIGKGQEVSCGFPRVNKLFMTQQGNYILHRVTNYKYCEGRDIESITQRMEPWQVAAMVRSGELQLPSHELQRLRGKTKEW